MKLKMVAPHPAPDDDLKVRLRRLGLFGVIANWEELADQGLVSKIVEIEEIDRRRRSLERRVKSSRVGKMKVIADFDWSWPKKIDRDAIDDLFRLRFIEQAVNVILIGPNGVGKTMIAKNLAQEAVMQGRSALFVNAAELLSDLKKPDSASALERRLASYAKPDILVVDELGYLAAGDRDGDLFFQLISRRYESKPTVITTNKAFSEWNAVFPNSACTATLIDRLVHKAEILIIDGESYRRKEAREREEEKRRIKRKQKTQDPDDSPR